MKISMRYSIAHALRGRSGFPQVILRGIAAIAFGTLPCTAGAIDISWTGPEDGQWHVGSNWSSGTVPEPGDNVIISGANVTVSDVRQIDGSFTLSGGALFSVAGPEASFTATGPTSINNGKLSVGGGALLDLSQAPEFSWTSCESGQTMIFVSGAGSVLDLSGVQTLSIDVPSCTDIGVSIFLTSGGLVDFSALETISAPGLQTFSFNVVLGGQMLAPNLSVIDGDDGGSLQSVSFIAGADVTLDFPALTTLNNTTVSVAGGRFQADAVTEANFCLLSPAGDDSLSLDSLEIMRGGGLTVPTTGRLTLPELTLLSDTFVLLAEDSTLTVPKLAVVEGTDAATSFASVGSSILSAPLLTSARNVVFVNTSLGAGSELNLTALRTYTWDLCEGGAPFTTGGAGSLLDLSGLQTISVTNAACLGFGYVTGATGASHIDLSALTTITAPAGQFVSFIAGGTGTVIDLSSLVHFNPLTVSFFENDNGQIIRHSGGEGEGEGEGKAPGCGVANGDSDFGSWGPGDTVLVLGLLAAIGLGGRRKVLSVKADQND